LLVELGENLSLVIADFWEDVLQRATRTLGNSRRSGRAAEETAPDAAARFGLVRRESAFLEGA
jgi:hypothetical protein